MNSFLLLILRSFFLFLFSFSLITALTFTKEEQKWLTQNKIVTFSGDPNWLPFEAFDEEGNYIGIVADYLKNIEKILPIVFNPKKVSSWSETIAYAKKGNIDVISDDIYSVELSKYYKPITPYIKSPIVIVMRDSEGFIDDIGDISNKKIALIKDYGYNNKIKQAYPGQKFIYEENADTALESLSLGKIDAALLSMPKAGYTIRTAGYTHLKIVGKTTVTLNLTLFVKKSKPELYSMLSNAMKIISHTEHLKILGKWQKVKFARKIDYTLVYQILGLFLFFILGIWYWYRRLKSEVR